MSEPNHADGSSPESSSADNGVNPETKAPSDSSSAPSPADPAAPPKLTAEEQMALYEEHLKETDWGHQPC